MDKNIKIFAVLAVLCLLTMPASAKALPRHSIVRDQYIVKVSGTNSIQVDGITGDSTSQAIAAKYLVTKKGIDTAGRDVMTLAKENNMKVRRPTFDVKNEIGTHAIMYSKTKHAMPVDIGINERIGYWFVDGCTKFGTEKMTDARDEFLKTVLPKPVYIGDDPIPSNVA